MRAATSVVGVWWWVLGDERCDSLAVWSVVVRVQGQRGKYKSLGVHLHVIIRQKSGSQTAAGLTPLLLVMTNVGQRRRYQLESCVVEQGERFF